MLERAGEEPTPSYAQLSAYAPKAATLQVLAG